MADLVKPVKWETPGTGGSSTDFGPETANPNQDGLAVRSIYFQNDTSYDKTVEITRDGSNNLTFVDPVVGTKTLQQLVAVLGSISSVGTAGVSIIENASSGQLRSIAPGSTKINATYDAATKSIDVDVVEANVVHQNLSGAGTRTHGEIDQHIAGSAQNHAISHITGLQTALDAKQNALGYTPTQAASASWGKNSVWSEDTRNTNFNPEDRDRGFYIDFKANATDGLADGGTYHGVITFRSYGTGADLSGGKVHQVGFTENGHIHHRSSSSNTTWGSWAKVWDSSNDGAGSALDADYLDGQHGSFYQNAGNLNAGTLVSARLSGSPGFYSIDPRPPSSASDRHITLSDPTVGGLSLIKDYTFNGVAGKAPGSIEYSYDGTNWVSFTGPEMTSAQNTFAVDNMGQAIAIERLATDPNGDWVKFRMTWDASQVGLYQWFKYLYCYFSGNGHSMDLAIEKSFDGTSWDSVGTYTGISGWPSHLLISHPVISFNPNPTQGSHWKYVRLTFTPNWNASYPNNNIHLYHMKWLCTYPATYTGDRPFRTDYSRNVEFYGKLKGPGGNLTTTGALVTEGGALWIDTDAANYPQIRFGPLAEQRLFFRDNNNLRWRYDGTNDGTIWHSGNDGAGSGLDADKLDGQEGNYYATASGLSTHIGDTSNPHGVTAAQVGAPTTAQFTAHTGDTTAHITAAERTSWNAKATSTDISSAISTHVSAANAHDASKITQSASYRFVTDTEKSTWNAKLDSSALSGYATQSWVSSGYQPLDGDLTSIAGLAGTSGFLKKTAANTWSLDTNSYQTTSTRLTNLLAQAGTSGFLKKSGADTWTLDTSAYSLSTHDHAGVYQPAGSYAALNHSHSFLVPDNYAGTAGQNAPSFYGSNIFATEQDVATDLGLVQGTANYALLATGKANNATYTHQLAFNDNQRLYHRTGSGSTWNAWRKIWTEADFDPADYATLDSPSFTTQVSVDGDLILSGAWTLYATDSSVEAKEFKALDAGATSAFAGYMTVAKDLNVVGAITQNGTAVSLSGHNHAGEYAVASHAHDQITASNQYGNAVPAPSYYDDGILKADRFRTYELPGMSTFSLEAMLLSWGAGNAAAAQLAISGNNELFVRYGTPSAWGSWTKAAVENTNATFLHMSAASGSITNAFDANEFYEGGTTLSSKYAPKSHSDVTSGNPHGTSYANLSTKPGTLIFHWSSGTFSGVSWQIPTVETDFGGVVNASRFVFDMTGFTQVRFLVASSNTKSGMSGGVVKLYSNTVANAYGTTGWVLEASDTLSTNNRDVSSWINLASGSLGDVGLRLTFDTSVSPTSAPLWLHVRIEAR